MYACSVKTSTIKICCAVNDAVTKWNVCILCKYIICKTLVVLFVPNNAGSHTCAGLFGKAWQYNTTILSCCIEIFVIVGCKQNYDDEETTLVLRYATYRSSEHTQRT